MSDSDKYELFDTKEHCNVALPVNTVRDDYGISRFAPLEMFESGTTGAAVLPSDVVAPELAPTVYKLFPGTSLEKLKGGIGLIPEWRKPVLSRKPGGTSGLTTVTITSVNEFLVTRTVEVSGKTYTVSPDAQNVRSLLSEGRAVVTVGEGDDERVVVLVAENGTQADGAVEFAEPVGDLYRFLSAPTVQLASQGAHPVQLTPHNVEELSTIGVSAVTVDADGQQRSVYVSVLPPEASTGTARSALTVAPGGQASTGPKHTHEPEGQLSVAPMSPGSLYPTFEFVLHLPYRQRWELLGYSRGALLNTVSLAPQEETTIEVFTWNRVKRSTEDTLTAEFEATQELSFTDKDTREALKELTKDSEWTFSLKGEVSVPVADPVTVGAGVTESTKNSINDSAKDTHQTIDEAVRKATSHIKSSRQTKITETEEFGTEDRVTRKLKNPNLCHTLNVDLFEVLAHYSVTTELLVDRIRLCVLVSNPIKLTVAKDQQSAMREFLLAFEGPLRRALLFAGVYEKHFDSVRKLYAWERVCRVKCSTCACDEPAHGSSSAATSPRIEAARRLVASAATSVASALSELHDGSKTNGVDLCRLANGSSTGGAQAWTDARVAWHKYLYSQVVRIAAPTAWSTCQKYMIDANATTPEAADAFVRTIERSADTGFLNALLLPINFAVEMASVMKPFLEDVCGVTMLINAGTDDAGLDVAFKQLQQAVGEHRAALAPPANGDGKAKDGAIEKVAPEYPPKEIAAALADEAALVGHIQANQSYYRYVIWNSLRPSDRYAYLSGLGALTRYVDNDVLGFIGDKAVLPFRTEVEPSVHSWFRGNVLDNAGLREEPTPFPVTLPTPGVTLEARLGQCSACEDFIEDTRALDLDLRRAQLRQAQAEADRLEARVKASELEDPKTQVPRVRLELEQSSRPS
jgi:hypothetical protein